MPENCLPVGEQGEAGSNAESGVSVLAEWGRGTEGKGCTSLSAAVEEGKKVLRKTGGGREGREALRQFLGSLGMGFLSWDCQFFVAEHAFVCEERTRRKAELVEQVLCESFPYVQYKTSGWKCEAGENCLHPIHAELHNKVFRCYDPFWENFFPPWEPDCMCTVLRLTPRMLSQRKLKVYTLADVQSELGLEPPEDDLPTMIGYRLHELLPEGYPPVVMTLLLGAMGLKVLEYRLDKGE